jgi:flagellar hook-length control protein FliK
MDGVEGFGQVLRSVWGSATGAASTPAPGGGKQGQAVPADPDVAVATTEETAVQTAAVAVPERAVGTHVAVPTGKPAHSGKADHHADVAGAADLGASSASPVAGPVPEAAPFVVVNPAVDQPVTTVPSAPDLADSAPVSASSDQTMPVRVALATIGSGGGGMPAQGAGSSRSIKEPGGKQKTSTEAVAAPVAAQTQPNTVDALAVVATGAVHPAAAPTVAVSRAGPDVANVDGIAANGTTPSPPAPQSAGSGGQVESASAASNTLPQPVPAAGSDVLAVVSAPLPPNGPLVPAAVASPAASDGDHKVTLRPVEAAADPAKPAVTPSTTQQPVVPVITPVATPTIATPTAAVAAPHPAAPASPAEQLAPALLTLAKTPDGGQQMTVRLHPAELGMVQVRIAQAPSGTTQVEITAENPATLLALQRDQPQLHRTLDDAGIAAAGRTVTFHVAQPAEAAAGGGASASPNGQGAGQQGSAGRTGAGSADANGSAGGDRGSYPARERTAYPAGRRSNAAVAIGAAAGAVAASYRIGLDITA